MNDVEKKQKLQVFRDIMIKVKTALESPNLNENQEIEENNESEDLASLIDTSVNNNVSLDHDYLQKRPLTDHDYVAPLPKKTKIVESDSDGSYKNSALLNFLIVISNPFHNSNMAIFKVIFGLTKFLL